MYDACIGLACLLLQ